MQLLVVVRVLTYAVICWIVVWRLDGRIPTRANTGNRS